MMPANITPIAVSAGKPPVSLEISKATGAVIDLRLSALITARSSGKAHKSRLTLRVLKNTAVMITTRSSPR
ncbi:MAG TPA: hypothetical protein VGD78_08010 [Chthoniobacterales bacterium]